MDAPVVEKSAYELERGKPMPSKNHAILQGNLYFHLRQHLAARYQIVPEISLALAKEYIPDLALFTHLEYTPVQDEVRVEAIPECVIEILSPSQSLNELVEKSNQYFTAGVRSYWLVLPEVSLILVYHEPGEHTVYTKRDKLRDEVLGVELDLRDIFR